MPKLMLSALLSVLLLAPVAHAEEQPKPDDHVVFDLAAEDWVTTKTARVIVNVEAAVNGANAGNTRADMLKAVDSLAASDWRLISFNRNQDQTGLERWSASFETRLVETTLGGMADNAKKLSKAGMQLSVATIDFSPTLDEMETVRASLRTQIYKKTADQLAALNTTLAGRNYRVAEIDFGGETPVPMMAMARSDAAPMASMGVSVSNGSSLGAERSEKVRMVAHVVFSALPATTEAKH